MLGQDIGIDLGTSTILIYVKGRGIVAKEPAVVAVDKESNRLLAVGREAQKMLGRTPGNIVAVKPIKEGVISDYSITERMLRYFLQRVTRRSFMESLFKPRVVICVPSDVTEVEERAVIDAGMQAGARKVHLIQEPVAAALGAGIDINQPLGSLVVDIGGGTTDIAVVSLGGVVTSRSIKVAGDNFDEAIIRYIRKKYNILIGERTAEELKIKIGCVRKRDKLLAMDVRGRSLISGLPKTLQISSDEVYDALMEPAMTIVDEIRNILEETPPELIGDISSYGITLTGGGALVYGMERLIQTEVGIRTYLADEPESCVAYGNGKALDSPMILSSYNSADQRDL
ncbi:MAG: rod shape-determining protein MreB [Clostridia bacterium]|nr:rod shape-determining protein MreB [Clostridia bacterium]